MSELLWIAVPGGIDASGKRLLRVLVVPKLDDGTLEDSGMAQWPPPGLLENPTLTVEWRVDETAPPTETRAEGKDVSFNAQSGLWQRYFEPRTEVGNGARTIASHPVPAVSPTSDLAETIEATYAEPAAAAFAATATDLPEGYENQVVNGLAAWRAEDKSPPPPSDRAPSQPSEFHRTISLLREHPAALRNLGLIFELQVVPPGDPTELGDSGQLRVRWPEADTGLPAIVSPWTRYDRGFLPHSTSGRISAGMVTLTPDPSVPTGADDGGWKVVTFDVEGGTRKLRDAAQLLDGIPDRSAADPGATVSLPAMRSAGLQLVRVGRKKDFDERNKAATANAKPGHLADHVLDADDLVLGYRIDVKRGGGEWLSLHERIADYNIAGVPIEQGLHEEGHLKANGAVREADDSLRADEVVARWDGWSLALNRPRFAALPGVAGPERTDGGSKFWFEFVPKPESLPALRFGAQYSVRARVVDMAGGGLERHDPDADRCAIAEISYGRYQPVSAPGLHLPAGEEPENLGPAEAVDRVVVRSGPDVGCEAFDAANPGYTTRARRELRRPRGALDLAEQHRMLDRDDDEQTFAWVQRALAAADPALEAAPPDEGPLPDPAAGGVRAAPLPAPNAPKADFPRREDWPRWPQDEGPKTLELRDRKPGEAPLQWESGTLVVRLAPAEQLTLELSSALTEDFIDHFALSNEASEQATKGGRNPLITPWQPVTLVHAVRRPLREPRQDTVLQARESEPGQTFAILDPDRPLLGPDAIDTNSTARLEITGSWRERRDEEIHDVINASVQSIDVSPGDAVPKDELRHELGDTRHREVTYGLSAHTRFRQYFKADEDGEAFVARALLNTTVTIPNTALPSPPQVLGARPAFTWRETREDGPGTTTLRRQRLGGGLRVELARPWYETGDGERLAVLLWDSLDPAAAVGAPDPTRQPYLTQAGRDPIWETPDPERWPGASMLSGMSGAVGNPALVENAGEVLAVPYEPWFHKGRWYADVALPGLAAQSYCSFVRLALARYQPQSIAGHELSTVVRTEMVQLLPERTLTVRREGNTLFINLEGPAPTGPTVNRVVAALEECLAPAGTDAGTIDLATLGAEATDVPSWTPLPGGALPTIVNGPAAQLEIPPEAGPLRVRVREIELLETEPETSTPAELAERVTFTDVVELPE